MVGLGLRLLPIALILLLALPAGATPLATAAGADANANGETYRCDGDPLRAQWIRGAVDAASIPDPSTAPVPVGGGVLLQWRGLQLQLPRTNNAGPASFTDGRWWWSLEDAAQPRFRRRQGSGAVQDFHCERLATEP